MPQRAFFFQGITGINDQAYGTIQHAKRWQALWKIKLNETGLGKRGSEGFTLMKSFKVAFLGEGECGAKA